VVPRRKLLRPVDGRAFRHRAASRSRRPPDRHLAFTCGFLVVEVIGPDAVTHATPRHNLGYVKGKNSFKRKAALAA